MNAYIKYSSQPTLGEQQQILSLLDGAFGNPIISTNTRLAFFSGYQCDYSNFVLLMGGDAVIGAAIVAKRRINLLGGVADAISVGPIAISLRHQRQGYSEQLMAGIDKLADDFGADLLYLQGIDGFYDRYDYYTCSSKSKLTFKTSDIVGISGVSVRRLRLEDISDVSDIFRNNAAKCSFSSLRSLSDWIWLVKYACATWYFFEPTLVLNDNKPIGYFCSDSEDPGRIREAVFDQSEEGIRAFLAGLKIHCQQRSIGNFQVMTWLDSALYIYAKKNCNSGFAQFFKTNGSQMMKIRRFDKVSKLMNDSLPKNLSLKAIQRVGDHSAFRFELNGSPLPLKVERKFIPGIICGFFGVESFQGFEDTSSEFKKVYANFANNVAPPFFFQGDNY